MTDRIKGIIAICSNYGVGKSTFAIECGYHPKNIVYINDDVKDVGINSDQFAYYVDLVNFSSGLKLIEFHNATLKLIDELPSAKVLIWDTWTRFGSSLHPYVKKNENKFREDGLYGRGTIHGAEWWQDAHKYEGQILAKLREKFDLVILTFHLKKMYENNVAIIDAQVPGNSKAINQYADLRIWLTPNPYSQVPIGLVLKNISKRTITNNGIKTQQVLPLRIENCNWETVFEYWDNPIGNRTPNENEMPTAHELAMIQGTLTSEQKRIYEASLHYAERVSELDTQDEMIARVKESTGPVPVIFAQLKQEYPNLTLDQVQEWRNE